MRKLITPAAPLYVFAAAIVILAAAIWLPAQAKADDRCASARRYRKPSRSCHSTSASQEGIFKKNGLDVQGTAFAGDAKLQQAMAADSIDVALGSGPGMAFIAKGSPVKAIAAMAGAPLLLAIVVRPDGPKTVADLKGKKVSVSTLGSLTAWLVSQTSRRQGWGPQGIEIEPMGAMPGQIAALKRGDIDGIIMDIGNAFDLEKKGEGRILVRFARYQGFHHSRHLRDQQSHRQPARTICAISSKAGSRPSPSCARIRTKP